MNLVKSVVVALSLAAAAPATAATVTVSAQPNAFSTGISASYGMGNVYAGTFNLNADSGDGVIKPFVAFCLSPFTWLNLNVPYVKGTMFSDLTGKTIKQLSALANGAWQTAWTNDTAGAFQLAAWEIVSETKKDLNLGTGTFVATASSTTAYDTAQDWLASVANHSFSSAPSGIAILSAENTQDLLTYDPLAPVPVPGALGLLAAGLAAFAAMGRKRRA